MTAPFRPLARGAEGPGDAAPLSALAYVSEDGSLAVYNDYETGRSVTGPPPDLEGLRTVAETWRRSSNAGITRPGGPADPIDGYGVFTFPYGPISMGVPESGKFEVRTYGERILSLSPMAGFKSRRILASVIGRTIPDAALRIERLAGNFSAAHTAAFLAAAESAQGLSVAREELWIRALGQELQRVYNHVHVLARVAEAAAQNVGAAQSHALAEDLLRLQGSVFGHRWLFGAFLPGGPRRATDREAREKLAARLGPLARTFSDLWELFLGSRTFIDRIQSTCAVPQAVALKWGAVGPTLRACGVDWDDRLRTPTVPYNDLFLDLPSESDGDALARLLVRAHEVHASFLLLEQLLDRWPSGTAGDEPPAARVAPDRGLGRVESPSGDLVYDVRVNHGKVAGIGMRSASQANFPVLARGLRDGVFTDFHFAWESFGIVFAEVDA
ncbi:MAG: NADH-quinone oxidoreductase subunit D-related protein [Thermoplasmata archaeon]